MSRRDVGVLAVVGVIASAVFAFARASTAAPSHARALDTPPPTLPPLHLPIALDGPLPRVSVPTGLPPTATTARTPITPIPAPSATPTLASSPTSDGLPPTPTSAPARRRPSPSSLASASCISTCAARSSRPASGAGLGPVPSSHADTDG